MTPGSIGRGRRPTGMAEGGLQVARLSVMLLWLAWLFVRLGRGQIGFRCVGLLQPVGVLGMQVERLVVRLSWFLRICRARRSRGWRRMLQVTRT